MRRAAVSVPANIAEGFRKRGRADKARFMNTADINGMPTPEENYNHPLGGLLYGFSVLDCLGCGTFRDGGAGLGTLGYRSR
jgi:hypothetical protein